MAQSPGRPDGLPAPPVPCGLCSLCYSGARPEASSSTHPPSVVLGVAAPGVSSRVTQSLVLMFRQPR